MKRALLGVVSLGLAVTLLVVVLPRVTGAGWAQIWAELRGLTPGQVALLTGLWFLGVVTFSWVLTGALPGLTHGQAVTMNLAGSAVSNVVPFGGAFGVAMSHAMARSFGFRRSSIGLFVRPSRGRTPCRPPGVVAGQRVLRAAPDSGRPAG